MAYLQRKEGPRTVQHVDDAGSEHAEAEQPQVSRKRSTLR